jgi:hypothetical protein
VPFDLTWTQIALGLAGIVAVAWFARHLRLEESRLSSPEKARALAGDLLAAFDPVAALVSGDGSAALVAGGGSVAVLKRTRGKLRARRLLLPLDTLTSIEGVRIETHDPAFGAVTLFGVLEADVRRLEAESSRALVVTLH